jgi:mono/diheme cytochrome c family protein
VRRKNRVLSMLILILGCCLTTFPQEKPQPLNAAQGMTQEKAGQEVFRSFCAVCHGPDAKGNGPAAPGLKKHPPDLTQLSRKNSGKFPYAYVTGVLRFGPGVPSHGSGTMPMWGALFEYYYNKSSAEQRIQNVCDYLASLQEK